MAAPLISDTWERGDPYEQYVGRWSRRVAPQFLSWLNIPAGHRWLDVGCGTGPLSAAILDQCAPVSVIGVEPSEGFLEQAKAQLGNRVLLRRGSAAAIPLDDRAVEVTVSGLVLNFVPNGLAAVSEMARVTASGGTIAAYVWDYSGKMELIRHFWDAAVRAQSGGSEAGRRDPLSSMPSGGAHRTFCQRRAARSPSDGN